MKHILSILCLIPFVGITQNYQPFNENQPKRFVNVADSNDDNHFFYPYQFVQSGDSSIFNQYFRLSNEYYAIDSNFVCPSWGGNDGPTGDTTWLGRTIIYESINQTLRLSNYLLEPLTFDFDIALGDSSLFYSNAVHEYYIKYAGAAEEVILGQTDSVKSFTILHYNILGTPVNQGLNGFNIKIGKELGLLQFIDCHQFPAEEIGYELMGQLNPNIGKYQLTYDEAYPWQVGDKVQYLGSYSYYTGAWVYNQTYTMYIVEDRIETTDSVWLYFSHTSETIYNPSDMQQNPGTTYNISLGDSLGFKKGENISEYPSGMMPYPGTGDYQFTSYSNPCGTGLKEELNYDPDWSAYCDSCQCMLPYDGFVTNLYSKKYRAGHGIISQSVEVYGPQPQPSYQASLVYSHIDGMECGTPIYTSLDDSQNQISIYPNPVNEFFKLSTDLKIEAFSIYDLNGKLLETYLSPKQQELFDLSWLSPGVYTVNCLTQTQQISIQLIKL